MGAKAGSGYRTERRHSQATMRPEYKWIFTCFCIFTCSSARGAEHRLGASRGMEHQTVRVPAECLSQAFRKTQKTVTKELTSIVGEIGALGDADDAAAILERWCACARSRRAPTTTSVGG